jgi:hypothetical protein
MTRQYQEMAKQTAKAVKKRKTSEYVKDAAAGHSGAKKVLAMADKPHKAKKAYLLDIKKNIKHSKEDLSKANAHMKKYGK